MAVPRDFQRRVHDWMISCFGEQIAANRPERSHRFMEEAIELAQACDMSANECHQLVNYVFNRPVGEPFQEVGGVILTLSGLCFANGVSLEEAAESELLRCWTEIDRIRKKQLSSPAHSPLPE